MPVRVLAVVLALGVARSGAPSDAPPRVLLWPDTPALAGELVELQAESPADPAPRLQRVLPDALAQEIEGARSEAAGAEHAQLVAIEAGLADARDAFLAQRWTQMESGLLALEQGALAELADPRHCESLWELEFRLALAYRGRKQPGDDARVQQRLAFALALVPTRRPLRELYGPDVVADFLDAVDAASGSVARPLRVSATPADAQVSIDCVPLPEAGRAWLRPGLHVVHARAPGHRVHAAVFELPADGRLVLALSAHDEPDAVRRLGLTTADGALPMNASGRRALVAAAAVRGNAAVVVLQREGDHVAARALSGAAVGPWLRASTLASAMEAALAQIDDRGHLRASPIAARVQTDRQGDPRPRKPLVKRWWFWASIAATVGLAVGLGVGLGLRAREPDHFEIVAR